MYIYMYVYIYIYTYILYIWAWYIDIDIDKIYTVRDTGQYKKKDLNIKVSIGTFTLYFGWFFFCLYKVIMCAVCNYRKAEVYSMSWIQEATWWEGNTI